MTAVKINREDQDKALDLDHELPSGESESAVAETQAARDNELAQLKTERDTLYDRLARLQAEFETFASGRCVSSRIFVTSLWRMR